MALLTELTLMHAALRKVAKVPPDQLDEGVKIWTRGPTSFGLLVSVSSFPLRLRFVPSKKVIPVKSQVIMT